MNSDNLLSRIPNVAILAIIVVIMISSMPAFADLHQSTGSSATNQTPIVLALNKHIAFGARKGRTFQEYNKFKVARTEPEDGDLAVMAIHDMLKKIDLTLDYDELISQFDKATESQKIVFAVCIFQNEVNNNGFVGYFTNDAGNLIEETKKGLALVGARRYLNLLRKALFVFSDDEEMLDETANRLEVLSKLDADEKFAVFEPLDSEFELLENESLLQESLNQYIEKHQSHFFIKP